MRRRSRSTPSASCRASCRRGPAGSLTVAGVPLADPLEILAVGQPETLAGSLARAGGPIAQLAARTRTSPITVNEADLVDHPADGPRPESRRSASPGSDRGEALAISGRGTSATLDRDVRPPRARAVPGRRRPASPASSLRRRHVAGGPPRRRHRPALRGLRPPRAGRAPGAGAPHHRVRPAGRSGPERGRGARAGRERSAGAAVAEAGARRRREAEVQPGALDVFRNRPFLLLWLSQLFTQIGGNMVLFGLTVIVLEATSSNTAVSLLILTFLGPAVAVLGGRGRLRGPHRQAIGPGRHQPAAGRRCSS